MPREARWSTKRGSPPPNVEHAGLPGQAGILEHLQGHGRKNLEPTDVLLALGGVDAFPMILALQFPDRGHVFGLTDSIDSDQRSRRLR